MKTLKITLITALTFFATIALAEKKTPKERLLKEFDDAALVMYADYRTENNSTWITPLEIWKGRGIKTGVEFEKEGNIENGPNWKENGESKKVEGQAVFFLRSQANFRAFAIDRFENGKMKFGGFPLEEYKALLPIEENNQ